MIRIGITSVGGVTARVFIKSLRMISEERFYIVGFDANSLAYGFKFVDKAYLIPLASQSEDYLNALVKICEQEHLDILVPLMDEEFFVLADAIHMFEKVGTKVTLSPRKSLFNCLDKLATYRKLGSDIFARTVAADQYRGEFGYPIVMKPKTGRGTRDTYICYDELDFKVFKRRVKNSIIQEFLEEPEYTVDVFSDMKGKALIAIPRRRIKIKAGVTWQGVVEKKPEIEKLTMSVAEELGIKGPSCIQVRYKNGKPKVFEVNPRIGGTTILSVLAGVNIPYLTVKLFLDGSVSLSNINIKRLYISRYFDEVVFDEGGLHIYENRD